MIISYCLNPNCPNPKNHPKLKFCYTCGANLVLNNRYRAIKQLGKGGFGATFIGVDLTIKTGNPLCVVKQLRPATEEAKTCNMALSLFQREAEILRKIDHPQIPKLIDYFVENQDFYLIQELINGQNLRKEVKNEGILTETGVKRFLEEILPVIQYIHSQKVIHRDIKPANILRRKKDNKLILIDFGAVKDRVNTELVKTYGQTALTKFAVGTIGYAPPEQLAMRPVYASDIYALGATCLFLLTGKSPKDFSLSPETGKITWEGEVHVSSSFGKILNKMLEPDIHKRFNSAREVIEAMNIVPLNESMNLTAFSKKTSIQPEIPLPLPLSEDITQSPTNISSATKTLQKALERRRVNLPQKKIKSKWDEKRFFAAYHNGQKDFSQQDLSHLNLQGIKLNRFVFRYSNLEGTILPESNLSQANFYAANLKAAILYNSNLFQSYFFKSDLEDADLRGANLGSADLTNANLTRANLYGANLKNAKVNQKQLKQAKINRRTTLPDGSRYWWKLF